MGIGEVESLVVKLAAITDKIEARIDHATRQSLQAAQQISHNAQQAQATSDQVSARAIEHFRKEASGAIINGVREAVAHIDKTVQAGTIKIESSANHLEQRIRTLNSLHTANAWWAFVAAAVGSLAVIAAAAYIVWNAHHDLQQTRWVEQINAAEAAGKLAPCPEGGLCVYVDKKWVRVDK